MPTTENHKQEKAATGYVRWSVIALVLILIAAGIAIHSFSQKDEVAAHTALVQVAQKEAQGPTLQDPAVQEPTEANSEISGRYYGLCTRNSIHSVADFRSTVENDPVLSKHFEGFNWQAAHLGTLDNELWTYVSYRKDETIRRTSKPVRLPKGDGYITDGARTVRTFCCNDYVVAPPPGSANAGPTERVDSPQRRIVDPSKKALAQGPPANTVPGEPPPPVHKSLESPPNIYNYSNPGGGSDGVSNIPGTYQPTDAPVPEPSAFVLLIAGIGIIAFFRSKISR